MTKIQTAIKNSNFTGYGSRFCGQNAPYACLAESRQCKWSNDAVTFKLFLEEAESAREIILSSPTEIIKMFDPTIFLQKKTFAVVGANTNNSIRRKLSGAISSQIRALARNLNQIFDKVDIFGKVEQHTLDYWILGLSVTRGTHIFNEMTSFKKHIFLPFWYA